MKQAQRVIYNRGISKILFSTPWSLRSIFKHVVILLYIALITVIAFDFNTFKDAIENTIKGSQINNTIAIAKSYAPQLVWDILLVFIEVRLLRHTLQMLQMSNRNIWVFIPFALVTSSFAIFVAVFCPQWMKSKILNESDFISGFKQISVFTYFYLVVPSIATLWLFANAFNERKVSPFITKSNIFSAFTMIAWLFAIGFGIGLVNILLLGQHTIPFNSQDNLQIFLIIAIMLMIILTIVLALFTSYNMRKKVNYKFFNKNIGQAIIVVLIVPLAIWIIPSFFHIRGSWMEWLFIGIVICSVLFVVIYSLLSKSEIGSPRVFMVVISLNLTIIWMAKFFFEYFWNYNVNSELTLPIASVGTAIIFLIMYFKSPMISKLISYLFTNFSKSLWLVVVASWGFHLIPLLDKFIPGLAQALNLILMSLPILTLSITLLDWYITQWKIKSHIILKGETDTKNIKEAINV